MVFHVRDEADVRRIMAHPQTMIASDGELTKMADLTLFDPARVGEVGTFADPHHYPVGIPWVFVNGVPVVANGAMTPARPGRAIRKPR